MLPTLWEKTQAHKSIMTRLVHQNFIFNCSVHSYSIYNYC